jgi:hypothetical protein
MWFFHTDVAKHMPLEHRAKLMHARPRQGAAPSEFENDEESGGEEIRKCKVQILQGVVMPSSLIFPKSEQ